MYNSIVYARRGRSGLRESLGAPQRVSDDVREPRRGVEVCLEGADRLPRGGLSRIEAVWQ